MIYITHIRLSPPNSRDHQHITDLKWRNATNNNTGQNTREAIVKWIEDGNEARVEGNPDVRVYVVDGRPKYLRTAANNTYTDNLLNLPRF